MLQDVKSTLDINSLGTPRKYITLPAAKGISRISLKPPNPFLMFRCLSSYSVFEVENFMFLIDQHIIIFSEFHFPKRFETKMMTKYRRVQIREHFIVRVQMRCISYFRLSVETRISFK